MQALPDMKSREVRTPLPGLKQRAEFLALRTGPRFTCAQFVLQGRLAVAEEGEARPRIGYTVTKKTGNSVERSRIKRRLKMAATKAVGQYGKPLEGEAVIVARRSAINEPFGSLVANLTKGIDRLLAKGKKAH